MGINMTYLAERNLAIGVISEGSRCAGKNGNLWLLKTIDT